MTTDPGLQVTVAEPNSPPARMLIECLWRELGAHYGNTGPCEFSPADVSGEGHRFLIAWRGDEPVGCGALVPMEPGVGEIKRMYVEPKARRLGVARQILAGLEAEARALGYGILRLETGRRQPGAVAFYRAAHYDPVEAYGRHVGDPLSLCFEKKL